MKIKLNISLSLKLTLIVTVVSLFVIAPIALQNISTEDEERHILEAHYDKSAALIHDLNSSIGSIDNLYNLSYTRSAINGFKSWNEDIIFTRINLANKENELYIYAADNETKINKTSSNYYSEGKNFNFLSYKEDNTYYIPYRKADTPHLIILSPVNLSGEIIGTYEISLSMKDAYTYLDNLIDGRIKKTIITSAVIIFVLIFGFLFLLKRIIVNPIIKFRDTAKIIGKGNLDAKIDIKSRDELGELKNAFNQMAKDLKQSREKIEAYNQILERLIDQKDEFIGQLGHDLKNPMQPLVGLLPILIEKEKDPENKEMLEVMNANVEYMQDLIFDTLKLAKLRSDNIEFNYEKIDLKELSDQVIQTQKTMLEEKNIEIKNNIKKDTTVYTDKLRLSEVFKNLINNSVKYTKDSGGTITIDAKQEKNKVTVSIKDTGIGMNKEQLKKVFDEFYKADKQTSDYYSTGLGLPICKRIIENMGGKIWVDSKGKNMGTTFYFTIKKKSEK